MSTRPSLTAPDVLRHARIHGVGGYRPERVVTNEEICRTIDSSDEWIRQRSGIVTRRFAREDESVIDMSEVAARRALENAGVSPEQVGVVIMATVTHPYQTPAAAPELAHRLAIPNPAAFDISAACAGYCHAISLANDMVRVGTADYVLVVGVEKLSDFTDPYDRSTAFIFGDGAGAAVVGVSDVPGIGPTLWGSLGEQRDVITQREPWTGLREQMEQPDQSDPTPWPSFVMQGQTVFRWAVFSMAQVAQEAVSAAGLTPADLDAFVPPGEHAHHRRDDQGPQAARPRAGGPRHRRDRQHLRRLDPAGDEPDAGGGRGPARGRRPADRVRRRARVCRPGGPHALTGTPRPPGPGGSTTTGSAVTTYRRRQPMALSEQEILEGLAEIVNEETGLEAEEVQMDKSFTEDLDIDSLSMMTIVVNAEDKFGVRIPDDEVKNLTHVRDAVTYINNNQG